MCVHLLLMMMMCVVGASVVVVDDITYCVVVVDVAYFVLCVFIACRVHPPRDAWRAPSQHQAVCSVNGSRRPIPLHI